MCDDKAPLLIKRYASRRLYNTETSDYITLQQIADCIRSGRDVRIVDLKSGEDLTRQYLIQIIADHEARGEQVFPLDVLMEVVRSYNDQARDMVPRFLDASFAMMRENQAKAFKNLKTIASPLATFEEMGRAQKARGTDAESRVETELDELKRTVAELQTKVANL